MQESPRVLWMSIILLIGAIIVVYVFLSQQQPLLGEKIEFITFTNDGVPSGKAMLSIPVIGNTLEEVYINAIIDANGDGQFSIDEWVVKNVPETLVNNTLYNIGFRFKGQPPTQGDMQVEVVAGQRISNDTWTGDIPRGADAKKLAAMVKAQEVGTLLDFAASRNPEQAMKQGQGTMSTSTPSQTGQTALVPDLMQRKAECAPTVGANGFIALASRNGAKDMLPADPIDMIDQLRQDMQWNTAEGVIPDNFVGGSNAWATRLDIPIRTQKVGSQNGENSLVEIKKVLDVGGIAALRLQSVEVSTSRVTGGHMVLILAIRTDEGHQYIEIHDPASPAGTDIYEVVGNQIIDYSIFPGDAFISWGFTHVWEE